MRKTIEATVTVAPDGHVSGQLPPNIPPGEHHILLLLEEPTNELPSPGGRSPDGAPVDRRPVGRAAPRLLRAALIAGTTRRRTRGGTSNRLRKYARRLLAGAGDYRGIPRHTAHLAQRLCSVWAQVVDAQQRKGRVIQTADAWIAATAIFYQIPLISHNRADYQLIDHLTLISEG